MINWQPRIEIAEALLQHGEVCFRHSLLSEMVPCFSHIYRDATGVLCAFEPYTAQTPALLSVKDFDPLITLRLHNKNRFVSSVANLREYPAA